MNTRMHLLFVLLVALSACASASTAPGGRVPAASAAVDPPSVLLWVASPFGFWGGEFNQSKLDSFLNDTQALSATVDTISLTAFFLGNPGNASQMNSTGGLVHSENSGLVIRALQKQGFRVAPLIGNFYGTNTIDIYRYYWGAGKAAFRAACVSAVRELKLDALNFDFEPTADSCTGTVPPCSEDDANNFAQLLNDVSGDLKALPGSPQVSVDTGQSLIAKTSTIKLSTVGRAITMNTYYGISDFEIALPRDLGRMGAARFGLGVCPGCYKSNASDIMHRMGLATSLGVRHVAYWAGAAQNTASNTQQWWAAIAKWKKSAIANVMA